MLRKKVISKSNLPVYSDLFGFGYTICSKITSEFYVFLLQSGQHSNDFKIGADFPIMLVVIDQFKFNPSSNHRGLTSFLSNSASFSSYAGWLSTSDSTEASLLRFGQTGYGSESACGTGFTIVGTCV